MDVINIKILPDGKIQATVAGVEGPACSDLSAFLDSIGKVEIDQNTDDYYKDAQQKIQRRRVI